MCDWPFIGSVQNAPPLHTAPASYNSAEPLVTPVQPSLHPPASRVALSATPILPHLMHGNLSAETKTKVLCGEYVMLKEFTPRELLPPGNTMEPYADICGTLALHPNRKKIFWIHSTNDWQHGQVTSSS